MKTLFKVLVPASIVLIIGMYFIFSENTAFVFGFSIVVLVILFNLYFQIFFFSKKNQKIVWLSRKLKDTKDIVARKDIAEKRVISEMPMGIVLYDEFFVVRWANNFAKDIFDNVLIKRNLETLSTEIFDNLSQNNPIDTLVIKIYTNEYEIIFDTENKLLYLTTVSEREKMRRKYEANTDVIGIINLDNLDDAISVLDVSERSYIHSRFIEVLEDWAEEFNFYIIPITNSKLVVFMNKENLLELIDDGFKILDKAVNENNPIVEQFRIVTDQGKYISVEEFLDKIKKLKIRIPE